MPTKYSEHNRANYIGVLPAHDGEQLIINGSTNLTSTTLYTVPANKIVLINSIFAYVHKTNANGYGAIEVFDSADVKTDYLIHLGTQATGGFSDNRTFPIPYELPAGYWIRISCAQATDIIIATIHAILVDA